MNSSKISFVEARNDFESVYNTPLPAWSVAEPGSECRSQFLGPRACSDIPRAKQRPGRQDFHQW